MCYGELPGTNHYIIINYQIRLLVFSKIRSDSLESTQSPSQLFIGVHYIEYPGHSLYTVWAIVYQFSSHKHIA